MMTLRKVEKLVENEWLHTTMDNLVIGDKFRMTEPGEDTPFGTWIVISPPRIINGAIGVGVESIK